MPSPFARAGNHAPFAVPGDGAILKADHPAHGDLGGFGPAGGSRPHAIFSVGGGGGGGGGGIGSPGSSSCRWAALCGLVVLVALGIGAAALSLALQTFRPPVWLDTTPTSPSGYYYGGAVHQGSGMWITNKPVLPSARSDLVAVAVADKILLLGGLDAQHTVLRDTLEFDPIFERYNTTKRPMLTPRYRHAGAAVGTKVYAIGGVVLLDGDPVNTVEVYDVLADTWTAAPPMSLARSDLAAATVGGKVYAFGGYGIGYDMSVAGTLVECFDPATNAWTVRRPMPTSRGDVSAVAFGNRIFVLGGWADDTGNFKSTTEAYSPASNSWATHANMIIPKGDIAAAVYRGKVMSVGGEIWSGQTELCPWDPTLTCNINQVPTHDCVALDPDSAPASVTERSGSNTAGSVAGTNGKPGVWVPLAPNPGARFRFAGAAHPASQALWVFGGTKDQLQVVDTVSAFYDTDHAGVYVHYKA